MANSNLFRNLNSGKDVAADVLNEAGGKAYALSDKHALAQLVITGTLNQTYYSTAEDQLDTILKLAQNVPAQFLAQLAVYGREKALMKDSPALLCAVLASRDVSLLKPIFNKVIDNGKMLRNFVQIVRSGKVGRKSFGTAVKKLVQRWFANRKDWQLFKDSIGNDPSLSDVIKLCHPAPATSEREALYAWIIGKTVVTKKSDMKKNEQGRNETVLLSTLPDCVKNFENYKAAVAAGEKAEIPDADFRMLTALNLSEADWAAIAKKMPWTATRMNLNTFKRHGVFNDSKMVDLIAERLANPEEVRKAKAFPYQLLNAFKNATDVPQKISIALQKALEVATENVPDFGVNKVHVMVDTSGSMGSAVTGNRGTVSTTVRCVDVAGLIAASVMRKNSDTNVVLFDTSVHHVNVNPLDSVMTNAQKFARGGGGTDCSCAYQHLVDTGEKGDLLIMVSDNESWADYHYNRRGTGSNSIWQQYKKRNPKARLVLIDLQPNTSTQVKDSKDVLNIGGFSDNVWPIIEMFAKGELDDGHFVGEIEKIPVDPVVTIVKTGAAKAIKKKDIRKKK